MFRSFYNPKRFRYIHEKLSSYSGFEKTTGVELIPKTACFFSEKLDVYIDTSDGVNDDLGIQEYCGRMLACIRLSNGKKFLYLKCCHSPVWSQNLTSLAEQNNGTVLPFFKWSFNDNFYEHTLRNIDDLRREVLQKKDDYDVGLFADFKKQYTYPTPSSQSELVSWEDIGKFNLHDMLGPEKKSIKNSMIINSRSDMLKQIESERSLNLFKGALDYAGYMQKSTHCKVVLNPPGIGEYTSRMMDQAAIGNVIVLRKNSYDQAVSWKNYIPEVDFSKDGWQEKLQSILDDLDSWREKSRFYFDNFWTPQVIFDCLVENIEKNR